MNYCESCDNVDTAKCKKCTTMPGSVPNNFRPVVPDPNSREGRFRQITEKMAIVYAAKNHDYGGSFTTLRKKYPQAILIRLTDKLSRLETLLAGGSAKVKDESIDDTLLDLANYAIMELVERCVDRGGATE